MYDRARRPNTEAHADSCTAAACSLRRTSAQRKRTPTPCFTLHRSSATFEMTIITFGQRHRRSSQQRTREPLATAILHRRPAVELSRTEAACCAVLRRVAARRRLRVLTPSVTVHHSFPPPRAFEKEMISAGARALPPGSPLQALTAGHRLTGRRLRAHAAVLVPRRAPPINTSRGYPGMRSPLPAMGARAGTALPGSRRCVGRAHAAGVSTRVTSGWPRTDCMRMHACSACMASAWPPAGTTNTRRSISGAAASTSRSASGMTLQLGCTLHARHASAQCRADCCSVTGGMLHTLIGAVGGTARHTGTGRRVSGRHLVGAGSV